ncbi:HAMP domain-containing histidine kinase [Actinoallomurus sp. NBC_01490]|uniref:sensor histidine kinase n=1 Tax=Actinoallomurus sp. NBC_01490 TaxID=2903557 RepID=UPI002E3787C8|nr:HAMP domain-containing sensor histidine kinase [Actinoallomurus sp. NBC_01490]
MRPLLLMRRLPPRTVRLRLTLLYGALFAVSGVVLLAVTYLLVSHSTGRLVLIKHLDGPPISDLGSPPVPPDALGQARAQAARQHAAELHELLVQSGIALAITLVISIALGWLVAGRVLRPLQTMTTTIQQISARNVHERLAVGGPRDELKDLADTVDGLLGRLETALDAHKRFVANAAHELRTPLTLEHALLEETLTDRSATLSSFRATFERLLANSEQQERLLESLLTLTRSERGLDRRRPLDLATVADHVLLTSRPEAGRPRVRAGTAPALASGDPTLVERLVTNLVDNATHYNRPDGWVEVTTATRAGRAVVSVANTGPVIPSDQVDRLFEPFQRLGDRTARNDGHHGLGLSIVRAIATAHDATVTARARPDGGLVVEVAFPVWEYAGEPTPSVAAQ